MKNVVLPSLTVQRLTSTLSAAALTCLMVPNQAVLATSITIDTAFVGNAGNPADSTFFGAVANDYRIGTTEVTNIQYAAFLNAKAASDPLSLYSSNMGSGFGGITRSGLSGSFTYSTITGRENMPVNFVSWYDAIRFTNWLHNGQGSGNTEDGAYTILGGTPEPSNGPIITRNAGALWFLSTQDEFYKAGYHKNDGATGNYFFFPTSSDTAPTAEVPPGGSNSANYSSVVGDLTNAGAYVDADSPYGTFDQGGNVQEWNESMSGALRGIRGGSFGEVAGVFSSSWGNPSFHGPTLEFRFVGFRVATVPEPGTGVLAIMGMVSLAGAYGWRRRRA